MGGAGWRTKANVAYSDTEIPANIQTQRQHSHTQITTRSNGNKGVPRLYSDTKWVLICRLKRDREWHELSALPHCQLCQEWNLPPRPPALALPSLPQNFRGPRPALGGPRKEGRRVGAISGRGGPAGDGTAPGRQPQLHCQLGATGGVGQGLETDARRKSGMGGGG